MPRAGVVLTTLSCLVFGAGVAAAAAANDYPLFAGQALRFGVAALALALVVVVRRRRPPVPSRRDALRLVGVAALGLVAHNVTLVLATRETDPSAVGVVVGATPIVLAVAAPVMARRRPSRRIVGAAIVVTLGAAIAQGGPGEASLAGVALSLAALASAALFSLLAVDLVPRLGALPVTLAVAALSAAMFAALVPFTAGPAFPAPDARQAAGLAFLGVAVIAYIAWYAGMDRLGADRAGLFFGLIPATSVLTVALIGEGTITPARLAGCALIIGGLVAGASSRPERARDARRAEHHERQAPARVHGATGQP